MRTVSVPLAVLLSAFLLISQSTAAEPTDIPELALKAMQYRVGKWESTGFIDGVKQAKPGKEKKDRVVPSPGSR